MDKWQLRDLQHEWPKELYIDEKTAEGIMGKNFIGTQTIKKYFDNPDLSYLDKIYIQEKVLKGCNQTHFLVPLLPISLNDLIKYNSIRGLIRSLSFTEKSNVDYSGILIQKIAPEFLVILPGWALIKKQTLEPDQIKVAEVPTTGPIYLPSATGLIYVSSLHLLETNEPLFQDEWIRTWGRIKDGREVVVKYSRPEGFTIGLIEDKQAMEKGIRSIFFKGVEPPKLAQIPRGGC